MERKGRSGAPAIAIRTALSSDAAALFALRQAAADELTRVHGKGPWSRSGTERSIAREIKSGTVVVVTEAGVATGMLALGTRKPWAIDPAYFTPARVPLYVTGMAVHPAGQRRGLGRALIVAAVAMARESGSGAIRLDAHDAAAGAGDFYEKCGFTWCGSRTYRGTPLRYYELLT